METESKVRRVHCLILAYPAQSHINPMLQFSKRLEHEGLQITLVTTRFFCKTVDKLPVSIALDTISDGFDQGRDEEAAENHKIYLDRFRLVGTETLIELIGKLERTGNSVDCIVYDSFLHWALDVAKRFEIAGAVFLTQALAVNSLYYFVNRGKFQIPLMDQRDSFPGLLPLAPKDMPSFLYGLADHSAGHVLVGQMSNIEEADWILCNSFYELGKEVAEYLTKIWPKLRTIGPTIPSMLLDKQLKNDEDYGFALFKTEECMKWLDQRAKGSVSYVSFGSLAELNEQQMEEIASGLIDSNCYFLWVVRASEQSKLPKDHFIKSSEKGIIVKWCPQLQVLAHEAVGCFVTYCGWNSTIEAISLGVPMVAMPQISDQPTNAKHVMDVWKMGLVALVDENGIVRGEALKHCIKEIMETENGKEMKRNALEWKSLAAKAVHVGGSSHENIKEFVNSLFTI